MQSVGLVDGQDAVTVKKTPSRVREPSTCCAKDKQHPQRLEPSGGADQVRHLTAAEGRDTFYILRHEASQRGLRRIGLLVSGWFSGRRRAVGPGRMGFEQAGRLPWYGPPGPSVVFFVPSLCRFGSNSRFEQAGHQPWDGPPGPSVLFFLQLLCRFGSNSGFEQAGRLLYGLIHSHEGDEDRCG